MNILLDPYILAVPRENVERAEAYMKTLVNWMNAAKKTGDENCHADQSKAGTTQSDLSTNQAGEKHCYWLSKAVLVALYDAGCYPNRKDLNELEEKLPPNGKPYNANTLLRRCEAQLSNPPLLDELFDNSALYYECDQVSVIPPAIAARLPTAVSRALQETLIHAAIGRELQLGVVYDDLVFGTSPNGFCETELGVDFLAQHIETDQMVPISQTWPMIFSPEDLNELGGLTSFWRNTESALAWAHRRLEKEGSLAGVSPVMPNIKAGDAFNTSVYALHLDKTRDMLEQLFKKIVLASVGIIPRYKRATGTDGKNNHHHPLKRGKNPIKREDDAEAWRLHIYASCRLHYWLLPDGAIELSKVCTHEDYTIE